MFYNDRGVTVTNARFEVPGYLFAVANITSVRTVRTSRSWIAIITILLGGLFMLRSGGDLMALAAGLVFVGVGLAMAYLSQRTILHVTTAGGRGQGPH